MFPKGKGKTLRRTRRHAILLYFIFHNIVFLILGTIVRKNNIITQVGIAAVAAIPLAFVSGVRTLVIGTDIKKLWAL